MYRGRVPLSPSSSRSQHRTLHDRAQLARYGVSYVRSVCAQAGVGINETSPDEDVLATDCDVKFREASVNVQVKCTTRFTIQGRTKSWQLEPSWVEKWSDSLLPVYFVLVTAPRDFEDWIEHTDLGTVHKTAAFWKRFDPNTDQASITLPVAQRLTADTLATWHSDMLAAFGGVR
ncbi:DUF4365 domain-containing protein [Promicromonospora sp. NPDC059942]|uniref:DUF4365 domain-containing protein n=1 Tax=Promicromonospora sp. NPDC059942 TaxID=3347009 RepID=UPI003649D9A7